MKKSSLFISTLATITLAGIIFAQTGGATTVLAVVEKMKAASHDFTLATELNAGQTDLKSGPLSGKKTGGIVTAEEYNRILEMLGEGGNSGGTTGTASTNLFGVRLASNYTSSEKVAVTVHWDTEDFDTDNQFDMTNHYFKPPQAGYYFLTANVCFDDLDYSNGNGPDQIWAFISKNGVGIGNASNASSSSIIFGTNNVTFSGLSDPCVHVSGIMQSDGDDYFSVAAFQDDKSTTPVKAGSNFYGFRINGGGTGGTGGGSTGGNGGISYTYYCFNNITRNNIGYYGTPHCPSTALKVGDPCPDDSSYTIKKILGSWGHCDGDFVWGDTGHFLPPGGTCTYSGISDSAIGSAYLCAQEGSGGSGGGWTDVPLTDTADFDTNCEYRFFASNPTYSQNQLNDSSGVTYVSHLSRKYIVSEINGLSTYGIQSTKKSQYGYRNTDTGAWTPTTATTITKIQKRCN